MENIENTLTDEQAKFCLLYVNANPPYLGDAKACYKLVYGDSGDDFEAGYEARKLLGMDAVKKRIEELRRVELYNSASLRPHITETLIGIMDECATAQYEDKDGNPLSPASLRAVSVQSAKTLADMYGIKEDVAHKISIDGGDGGSGVTFNVIMPEKRDTKEEEELI